MLADLLHHVLVAHRRPEQPDAVALEGAFEPEVAHHGGDDRVLRQAPQPLQVQRQDQHDRVAVDDGALLVHHEAAVAVAVEGDAQRQLLVAHEGLQRLQMRRPAAQVDVAAVGVGADDVDVEIEIAEQSRRHRGGGAIGAVQADAQAADVADEGQGRPAVLDVGRDDLVRLDLRRRVARDNEMRVGHQGFHLALEPLVELLAVPREHLDAVVFVGIVRRRDHDAGVEVLGARDDGHRRRRHHAGRQQIAPDGAHAAGQRPLDPEAGLARVAAREDPHRALMGQHAHERRSEPHHGCLVERRLTSHAAHTIGSKQFHRGLRARAQGSGRLNEW